ncbi:hypothetical protein ACFQ08_00950 [Streptosporangium algeriense]|uniref:Transposase IS111A/IS1328/IS1533 N-terminal domain-containing protein n=1 Tax=Streptosporangium algeriense TaxID=1682748 RepID=A0ABW3DGX0_9ACTN
MTPPPPASPEPRSDDKGTRHRAPVSDHSAAGSPASAWLLPCTTSRKITEWSQHDGPLFFAGIDWTSTEHAVCVLDRDGRKAAAFTIVRTAASAASLTEKRLAGFCAKQGCSGERLAAILLWRCG